ncbi:MAG: DMT family transporter [Burkholderiales bacterium]|nr:DMT family transporter [Burkholderiales bacterium]
MSSSPPPHTGTGRAGTALALLSCIWGYNWIAMKQSLAYASPTDSAAWRFVVAAIALVPVVLGQGHSLQVPRKEWWLAALLGIMLAANFTGTLWGLKLGGTGKVAVLCYTMPFWTAIFAWLFIHERMRRLQWIAVLVAAVGLVILVDPLHLGGLAPSLLALAAGCSWGGSVVIVKHFQGKTVSHLLTLTFWQMIICSGILFAAGSLFETPPVQWTWMFGYTLFYSGVLASAAAWMLFYFALARLPAGVAGLGTLATPVIGVIAAWLQFGEVPSRGELVGMAFICVGLAMLAIPPEGLRPVRR